MRTLLAFVFLFSFGNAFAQSPKPTSQIAYFDRDSLKKIMPEVKDANEKLDAYESQLQSHLYDMQIDYQKKLNEYDSLQKQWSPLIKALKEKELKDMEDQIQAYQASAQDNFDAFKKNLMDPIELKIDNAAKAVAVRHGYLYVLDSSKKLGAVVYASPSNDILNEIRIELKIPVPSSH